MRKELTLWVGRDRAFPVEEPGCAKGPRREPATLLAGRLQDSDKRGTEPAGSLCLAGSSRGKRQRLVSKSRNPAHCGDPESPAAFGRSGFVDAANLRADSKLEPRLLFSPETGPGSWRWERLPHVAPQTPCVSFQWR